MLLVFKNFQEAFEAQQKKKDSYDNGMVGFNPGTGKDVMDKLPFSLGEVVWVIMGTGFYLDDYEENATEYGVTEYGKWAALDDGHCSCYGWEADKEKITYYDTLDQLLKADPSAKVIMDNKDDLSKVYQFLSL